MGHSATESLGRLIRRRRLGTAAGVILGAVLLVAAWGKVLDPETFAEQIRIEGLDIFGLAMPVALVAIALEIGLGLALVLGLRRLWVVIPALALVIFFLFLTVRTYWSFHQGLVDESASCGCFGNLVSRTPAEAFWQDLFLLGIPASLMFLGRRRGGAPLPVARVTAVVVAVIGSLLLAAAAPELPLDDLATRLRPGVATSELCVGDEGSDERLCLDVVIPELDRGRHLVVLSDLEEPELLAAIADLNRMALDPESPPVWVLTAAVPEVVRTFSWTLAPAFEVREAPTGLLRPLHRRLPRSFAVEDGRVTGTFAGLPADGWQGGGD